MKKVTVPGYDQVSPGAQHSFDTLKKRLGKVPNLYAVIGYSEYALEALMTFEEILNKGVFNPKEREAIALVVSEVNGCEYCLAGHTLAAIKRGMTRAETLDARRGHMADPRLNAIVRLAKSIAENKGKPDARILEAFYNTGFDEGAVMELIGFVTVRIYTNYVFAYSEIPIDFPMPEPVLMTPLSEEERLQLGKEFLSAWKSRDWETMGSLLSDDVVWSLPGESIVSGEVRGAAAIIKRAGQLKDFGVEIDVRHILFSQRGLALAIHNTAQRGHLVLDEWVMIVCELKENKISRMTTHLSDVPGINNFFVKGIIDQV